MLELITSVDRYTATLAAIQGAQLHKIIPATNSQCLSTREVNSGDVVAPTDEIGSAVGAAFPVFTHDLARLPYLDASVDVISARSLYKGVRAPLQLSTRDLTSCLTEFNRVLVPGGCLEFVYFQSELEPCGLLTSMLGFYLLEPFAVEDIRNEVLFFL